MVPLITREYSGREILVLWKVLIECTFQQIITKKVETNLPVLHIHGQFVSLFLDKGDKNVKNNMIEAIMYFVNFSFMYITAIILN